MGRRFISELWVFLFCSLLWKCCADEKPKATLTSGDTTISVGGKVSLSCSVGNYDGWKFEFFRKTSTTEERPVETTVGNNTIEVSRGGIYRCRGERETSSYLSDFSEDVFIYITFTNRPVITSQPSWFPIFDDKKVNLTCEVQGGGATNWSYDWSYDFGHSHLNPQGHEKLVEVSASRFLTGGYSCLAKRRDDVYSSTSWSEAFPLPLLEPVLSVSPSWLIPGASVTLICHIEHPSAGWSFYWFKAVPDSQHSYNYEPLPGTSNGTTNNSFTVHGQTHTEAYACSAGREVPLFYSPTESVWSSEVHPSASLTVNPARVQHFTSESLSLTCEGNSTQLKTIIYQNDDSKYSYLKKASINGSVYINNERPVKAVYWCETGTALSNAVNISTHSDGVILVSPVYPVPEGQSVTLHCELKAGNVSSDVFFYKNDKIIQNDTGEMKISAVSQSDEGSYKCQYKRNGISTKLDGC